MNKPLSSRAVEFCHLLKNGRFTCAANRDTLPANAEKAALDILLSTSLHSANVYIVGNGGSSAVASHIITDFRNNAHLRAITLHESSVLTCFANDYGYEHSFVMQLEKIARAEDVLIAISSSGQSENILNSAIFMKSICAKVITLSGFDENNSLRKLGDINYWVDSIDYGYVEIAHLFLLHHWADCLALKKAAEKSKKLESSIRCVG